MASFEDKVAALRRLRAKMESRQEQGHATRSGTTPASSERECSRVEVKPTIEDKDDEAHSSLPRVAPPRSGDAVLVEGPEERERVDPAAKGGVGEADALFCAGHCLEHGIHGCEIDLEKAAEMYEGAAEGGHPAAMWRLGELLERGLGVDQDEYGAFAWYSRSAEEGFVQAQSSLALLLEEGRGCDLDEEAALRWHLAAAESGHMLSQYCAGMLILAKQGTAEDETLGMVWLRRSAEAGFGPAVRVLRGSRAADADCRVAQSEEGEEVEEVQERKEQHYDDHDSESDGDRDECAHAVGKTNNLSSSSLEGADLEALANSLSKHLQDLDVEDAQALLDELLELPELNDPGLEEHFEDA